MTDFEENNNSVLVKNKVNLINHKHFTVAFKSK